MNIFFIRHAQSQWQTKEDLSKDSSLSYLGKKQSILLNNHIKNFFHEKPNSKKLIYTSPLKRALETINSLELPYIIDESLKEAPFHVASTLPKYDKPMLYTRKKCSEQSYKSFKCTLINFMQKLVTLPENSDVYIYTHGGVIKTILRILQDNDSLCYTINNCSITQISWHRHRWHISYLNDTSFIPNILRS